MQQWSSDRLVFVDESGVNLAMTRREAWAPKGQRIVDAVPGGQWETYSVIAGLRRTGVFAPMVLSGAMNGEALRAWAKTTFVPNLRKGDIVVWDNLSIHEDREVASLIENRGARLEFLPPYSPDLNPIEEAWSKMKAFLRVAKARARDTLIEALADALRSITPDDCRGWFAHAGYIVA